MFNFSYKTRFTHDDTKIQISPITSHTPYNFQTHNPTTISQPSRPKRKNNRHPQIRSQMCPQLHKTLRARARVPKERSLVRASKDIPDSLFLCGARKSTSSRDRISISGPGVTSAQLLLRKIGRIYARLSASERGQI